jgi:hypothetical protein
MLTTKLVYANLELWQIGIDHFSGHAENKENSWDCCMR